MKPSYSIVALCVCGLLACRPSVAQEAKAGNGNMPSASANQELRDNSGSPERKAQQFIIRVKTKQKVDFSGIVTRVDPATAILSIYNQGKTITFDMSRAILIGYQSTREIKKGDRISVGYTQYGLQIHKGILAVTHRKTVPQKTAGGSGAGKTRKNALTWWKHNNKNPKSFRDIDNDKDGKVTPIELCVLIPNLTLQKFREYDKNGDGCLSETEFNTAKITR